MAENEQQKWFAKDTDDVAQALETDASSGLSQDEASSRLEKNGKNELPEAEKEPTWKKFLKHFHDVLIYVLLAAAVVTAILGHTVDTIVILAVAVINATIGYFQESRAEKALEGIKDMLSLEATVIRGGDSQEIDASELVVGDLVQLRAGDKIPADLRVIEASNLNVEESALTGESTAVEKGTEPLDEDTILNDRDNMLFSGTSVSSGSGMGIVVEVAEQTEIGKINASISEVDDIQTPLLKQTARFGRIIAMTIVVVAAIMFVIGYFFRGYEAGEMLLNVIALAVAAIPEGLPAILSIILAIGVQNMAKRNSIIRNLPSVETLGSVSIIASDKTGTLTKNEMTVTAVMTDEHDYEVKGTGYAPEGSIEKDGETATPSEDKTLYHFLHAVKNTNDASLTKDDDDNWTIDGDPTDGCFLTLAEKAEEDIKDLEVISKIPFDSDYKYMAVLVDVDDERYIYMKGAPDRIFERADSVFDGGEGRDFNESEWEEKMTERAKQGERVIGVALKKVDSSTSEIDHEDIESGMQIIGLAGIVDPPREEAIEAVKECTRAGIQVKMITGDHADTAKAIGHQLGIGDGEHALTGREIDKMSDEELDDAALEYDVFARTSPENKLRLVEAFQRQGKISAMTGDGVNDAAALKRADIGVAMGIKGTEVAKDASEMVLVDDNFRTIVNAVEEGRRVYDNLKKTILFILPTNGAQALLIVAAILLGLAMPLTPVQILWVNMVTAVTISLALAFERLEEGAMDRPPRDPNAPLLSGYYIFRIILVSVIISMAILAVNISMLNQEVDTAIVHTVTLNMLVFAQLFHLFNCRSEIDFAFDSNFFKNKAVFIVSAILIALQLLITYAPFMHTLFGTTALSLDQWILPIALGFAVFVLIEIEKLITRTIVRKKGKTD
ncbi:cation-transporting P-type ATPase [Paenalkalicoccus suaedae]|uniref:Cation-transporting P-type ATPase n=1 Tax=Paenalkalicoccus suaedae TaxID=2592382 RepID=A0A859FAM0_9BACI|nr:cation-transporting P-type ATPase [Paenalkalicoccus suaedae]QKS69970.1 cation-transporting P-type ATPase [Paenalkalicoccus suaedae]